MQSYTIRAKKEPEPSDFMTNSIHPRRNAVATAARQQGWKPYRIAALCAAAILIASWHASAAPSSVDSTGPQATLVTDQVDYAPGSTAYISGTGFQPGEPIAVQVL